MKKSVVNVILIVIAIILIVLTIIVVIDREGLFRSKGDGTPDMTIDYEVSSFNSTFANYQGTQKGATIKTLLQTLAVNNAKQQNTDGHMIEVTFIDEEGNYLLENETDSSNIVYTNATYVYSYKKYTVAVTAVDWEGYYTAIEIKAVSYNEKTNNSIN